MTACVFLSLGSGVVQRASTGCFARYLGLYAAPGVLLHPRASMSSVLLVHPVPV